MRRFSRVIISILAGATLVGSAVAQYETFKEISDDDDYFRSQSQVDNFGLDLGAAESAKARFVLPIALDMLKSYEKWMPVPYNDPNFCTIGYGHLIAKAKCQTLDLVNLDGGRYAHAWSESQGVDQMDRDLVPARIFIQQNVTKNLTDEQFSALSLLVFNIGEGNFYKSKLFRLLNADLKDQAADQFLVFVVSKKKVMNGLIERRGCERALFLNKLPLTASGKFSRTLCHDLGAAPAAGDLIDIETGEVQ